MLLDYNRIDPQLRPAIDTFPALAVTRDNVVQTREALAGQPQPPSPFKIDEQQRSVGTGDRAVDVWIFRGSTRPRQAALLWIHGGGYLFGTAYDERARRIAHELDITVVSVEYRLAPEHPFPAGTEDCHAALQWLTTEADDLDIDRSRIAIGGASAGGGMAAGLALMCRDCGSPMPVFQLLLYPMLDNLHATASGGYENHPLWNRGTSLAAWEMYLDGTPGQAASPWAAATRATDLAGLPPAYVCVGSEDLFRDEDADYARRLLDADVPCELTVFPGMYHAGDVLVPEARVSRRLHESYTRALGDALQ